MLLLVHYVSSFSLLIKGSLEFLAFRNQNYTSFCHNCHILKPELLLPKTTTVQFVNSCGFKKQQFWFKDVTVVAKRCVVLIPESQKLKEKDFLRRNKLRGLVIGGLNCIFAI